MPISLALKSSSYINTKANTISFYAQVNEALISHGAEVTVRIKTPTKEINFTASVNSAHALITCVASTWSGSNMIVEIS